MKIQVQGLKLSKAGHKFIENKSSLSLDFVTNALASFQSSAAAITINKSVKLH